MQPTEIPVPAEGIVLLTGATGFLGKVILAQLLHPHEGTPPKRVYVLIRTKRGISAEQRFAQQIAASACFENFPQGWAERVTPVGGDVTHDQLGLAPEVAALLQREVTHIVHCAASVDFNLPLPIATQANVTSALAVLEFARGCQQLHRLMSVSTAYVHPHRSNEIGPTLLPLPRDAETLYHEIQAGTLTDQTALALLGHPNTYTFTKCLAEHLLVQRRGQVPLTILRPSIISVAQHFPSPGWIDSSAALAAFFLCFAAGYLRVIAGDPQTRLDVVPVDQVARVACRQIYLNRPEHGYEIVHAVAGKQNTLPLHVLSAVAVDYFRKHPQQRPIKLRSMGRYNRWRETQHFVHHLLPLRLARSWARLRGNRSLEKQASRLENVLEGVFRSFIYFTHRSYDFHVPSPSRFELNPHDYTALVCHGTRVHLLPQLTRKQAAT